MEERANQFLRMDNPGYSSFEEDTGGYILIIIIIIIVFVIIIVISGGYKGGYWGYLPHP